MWHPASITWESRFAASMHAARIYAPSVASFAAQAASFLFSLRRLPPAYITVSDHHSGGNRPRQRINAMATQILLPKLGFSMNEGQVAEWLAKDGDQVTEGQPLFALESDKSTNEVESPASGTLKIVAAVGETYEVGTVLGTIE
jgi:acetyl/propionyl-CoA carboxylase alpha subunit